MEERNPYLPPRSNLDLPEDSRNDRGARILRRLLRVTFGLYTFFAVVFCLFAVFDMAREPTVRSGANTATILLMAYGCLMAFRSIKHGAAAGLKFAVLVFISGFALTAVYRIVFVPGSPSSADLSNFLLFGAPAALTFCCARWEARGRNTKATPVAETAS